MGDEHRFTEEEVRVILARAVDLERAGAASPDVAGSLSLAELKEVASEAGIDEALVEDPLTPENLSIPLSHRGFAVPSSDRRLLERQDAASAVGRHRHGATGEDHCAPN